MFNEMMRAEIWLQDTLESQRTIDDLAERLGYSSSQIRRRFRQCFGMSPSAYRESLRLEKAARLLLHTPHGIRDIAARCGYTNHSAFSRAFQRRFRQSPRSYRQSRRTTFLHQGATADGVAVKVRRLDERAAVVARRYAADTGLASAENWEESLDGCRHALPDALRDATAIVLLHDPTRDSRLPRLDSGVLVDPAAADALAMPPELRLVELPSERCACVTVDDRVALDAAVTGLLAVELPEMGEYYNGEAIRLVISRTGRELQFPLVAISR